MECKGQSSRAHANQSSFEDPAKDQTARQSETTKAMGQVLEEFPSFPKSVHHNQSLPTPRAIKSLKPPRPASAPVPLAMHGSSSRAPVALGTGAHLRHHQLQQEQGFKLLNFAALKLQTISHAEDLCEDGAQEQSPAHTILTPTPHRFPNGPFYQVLRKHSTAGSLKKYLNERV